MARKRKRAPGSGLLGGGSRRGGGLGKLFSTSKRSKSSGGLFSIFGGGRRSEPKQKRGGGLGSMDVPHYELAGGLEGKTPTEAVEAILGAPDKVAEKIATPWRWEIERVLWEHDDFDALARAINGVVDDWPISDRELLRQVKIPTFIVGMRGDEIHPAALARLLADLLPNAELVLLGGQDELFQRIPELVARVSSFLVGEG